MQEQDNTLGTCSKCMNLRVHAPGLRVCVDCSNALDQQIVNHRAKDWVLTTVDGAGHHDYLYRNKSYLEVKKIWAEYSDILDSHFLRQATDEEIIASDREMAADGLSGMSTPQGMWYYTKVGSRVIWEIIKGFVSIGVLLGIYSVVQTPFEIVGISILVMIYSTVRAQNSQSVIRWTSTMIKMDRQFSDIRTVLGKPLEPFNIERVEELPKSLKKQQPTIVIHLLMLGTLDLIALWKIIHVVGWL